MIRYNDCMMISKDHGDTIIFKNAIRKTISYLIKFSICHYNVAVLLFYFHYSAVTVTGEGRVVVGNG